MKFFRKFAALALLVTLMLSMLASCQLNQQTIVDIFDIINALNEESTFGDDDTATLPDDSGTSAPGTTADTTGTTEAKIDENGVYTTKEDVALYIHTYNKLPKNFITKKEAEALGWTGGGLDKYSDGKCIGGDYFGNNEGRLPKKSGRKYTECDIDTLHKSSRGAKRIVFSNDGLIYYTEDHYDTFVLLYGEE